MTVWARTQLQIGFVTNPFDAVQTWTDVSADLRADTPVQIKQGRTNEFSKFDPGSFTCALNNRKRRYDPGNTSNVAPYAGNIQVNKAMQFSTEYPWFPGLLPDEDLRNTGWSAGTGTNVTGVSLINTDGYLPAEQLPFKALTWSAIAGGTAPVFGPVIPWTPNDLILFHARVRVMTRTQNMQVGVNCFNAAGGFISSIASGSISTTLGAGWVNPIVMSGTNTPAGTATVQPWIQATAALAGEVFRADTFILDRASQWISKVLSYTYTDDWKERYKSMDQWTDLKGTDALRIFAGKEINSQRYRDQMIALAPEHYYRLSHPVTWTGIVEADLGVGTPRDAIVRQTPIWGMPSPLLADPGWSAGFINDPALGGWLDLGPNVNLGAGAFAMAFWAQTPTALPGSTTCRIYQHGASGDVRSNQAFLNIYTNDDTNSKRYQISGVFYPSYPATTPSVSFSANFQPPAKPGKGAGSGSFYDGLWHFIVIKRATDGRTWSAYVDGVQVALSTTGGTSGTNSGLNCVSSAVMNFVPMRVLIAGQNDAPTFAGQTCEWGFWIGASAANLTPAQIANLYQLGQAAWSGQVPGQRIGVIADTLGFPSGMRNLDNGTATLMPATVSLALTNALDYMHRVEESENGWLLMDAGVLRFIGRQSFFKPPYNQVQYTFGDGAGEIPFEDWEPDFNATLLYTEAEGAREGYNTQVVYAPTATTTASTKQTISRTNLLNNTDADVLNLLYYLLTQYSSVKLRATRVIINPAISDAAWVAVLSLKIGSLIQINIRPEPAGSPIMTFIGRVQKLDHTINKKSWKTEITLGSADLRPYLILDDTTYGKLDMGNVYAY